jgi:PAS domain S-box-containing protein
VSLRFRLNVIVTLMVVLLTAVIAVIVVADTRRSIREEMTAGSKVSYQLMNSVLHNTGLVEDPGATDAKVLDFLRTLGRVRAHELRYYDSSGNLVYTSPPSSYKAGRDAPAWFSRLVEPELQPLELATAQGRVLIIPDASRAVLDAWDDLTRLVTLVLGFLVAVNLTLFLLLGRFLRPLGSVLAGLSDMERGRYDARLPHYGLPEFEAMSHTFNRMAAGLEESHAENRRLALVARQSSDAILICDLDGRITYWNPAAERLFGYAAQEIVGQSSDQLLPADGPCSQRTESLQVIRERHVIENLETRRCTRDGRLIDVALSAAPLIDPATDAVIGEILSMRDITEHLRVRETERELEQNRRLTQLIQTRLEEERRALARELHDELGQCVTAIRTIGSAIALRAQGGAPEIQSNAKAIVDIAGHIYDVVHDIIRELRPPALDNLGLRDALADSLSNWRSRHPEIACDLTLAEDVDELGEPINITLYRIVQECLTNVARHAAARRVDISLQRAGDRVELVVRDDGRGLDERHESDAARFGIMGMRERVQSLGGGFELTSDPGAGVTVRVSVPFRAKADAPGGARRREHA